MTEVSVFARMAGKRRHFRDLSLQVLSGVEESFDFVKFAENIGLPPFSVFNTLTGYRPYSHSVRENGSRRELFLLLAFFWPGLINPLST